MLGDPKTLLAFFGQSSTESLRYIHPLGRYVFIAAMIFFVLDLVQDRGWVRSRKPAPWTMVGYERAFRSAGVALAAIALVAVRFKKARPDPNFWRRICHSFPLMCCSISTQSDGMFSLPP